jgi:hypothetical protein
MQAQARSRPTSGKVFTAVCTKCHKVLARTENYGRVKQACKIHMGSFPGEYHKVSIQEADL